MTISSAVLDQIWTPDTYFENSKHSDFHYVTVPNKMFRLYPNGTVLYNSRFIQKCFSCIIFFLFSSEVANKWGLNKKKGCESKPIKMKWVW